MYLMDEQDAVLDRALLRESVTSRNEQQAIHRWPPYDDYAISRARHVAIVIDVSRRFPRACNQLKPSLAAQMSELSEV